MIYDTLNNLPNYLGVSDNLDTVIEYIMARDITTLPAGRTRIDGEKAVVTVSTVTPLTSDKALFQRHDNHITLETDLDGSELFEVSLAELTPTKPTDEATDTTVGTAGTSIAGMLCEGRFALYLAGEPYKSGLKAQGCGSLRLLCALRGTRILQAAAPTAPPCFGRWPRSLPLQTRGCSPLVTPKQLGSIQKIQVAPLEDFLCSADL